jgi:hypothetical protein
MPEELIEFINDLAVAACWVAGALLFGILVFAALVETS